MARKEILDRYEKYNWAMDSRIIIPMMPGNNKTLGYAFQKTINRLIELSKEKNCLEEINDIF